jgi:hypothetical protein
VAIGAPAATLAAGPVPRVAIVVGPVGGTTPYYKGLADQAASAARKAGAQVVKVYSPNATWPAVQEALTGASIVVYLGHGNGWPSRYRDSLYPPTQDGFGLNPVAGVDDSNHQYFGESFVGSLKLAPNAVVVLSHLCYASGNSEPGLPEGSQSDAIQRVDNFAAGFLKAGAQAVVAEAHMGPAYYVKSLLAGQGSIERIFGSSPSENGIAPIATASVRTPGYTVHLDPESASGGYVRSLVSKGGLTADEVRHGAMGTGSTTIDQQPSEPSLVSTGVRFAQPSFKGLPVATTKSRLILPFSAGTRKSIPAGAEVSVRWDPLEVDTTVAPADPSIDVTPSASAAPGASQPPANANAGPTASAGPDANVAPAASPVPDVAPPVAPDVDLVVSEQLGSVVQPVAATITKKGLQVDISFPTAPGLYRLVPMLHTPDGVAYDAATQGLVTPVLVRVSPALAAAYGVQPDLTVAAGATAQLPIRVLNAGSKRWDLEVTALPTRIADEPGVVARTTVLRANLVVTWVSVTGSAVPEAVVNRLDDKVMAPGGSSALNVALTAPADAGDYLLLIDVVAPATGPLSSGGVHPAIVRVTVGPAAAPAPAANPAPDGSPAPGADNAPTAADPTDSGTTPAPVIPPRSVGHGGSAGQPDSTSGGPKRPD